MHFHFSIAPPCCACTMWIYVCMLGHIVGALAFELFPNQDKDYLGTVNVELLWEENSNPGSRDKRSVPTLPGQLAFQFSVSGEKVVLNLKQNSDLNAYPSAYVVRGGRAVPEGTQYGRDNMGFYQDVTKGAAIMVKKEIRESANYELMGTYIVEEEQYTIQPIRVDSGSGSRKSVANHSIARMMTHISLRNDILDFVEGPVIEDSLSNSKRQKREAVLNTVELLIVTDYAIYNTWYQMTKGASQAEKRRKALENMKQYYAFVLNGIDLRYASIKEPDFRIDVTFAGIVMIDDPNESMWTVGLAGAENGGQFVESSDALESFRSWVLTNDTSFPPHDHVMLFTGYNLTYGGSTANAGLAYIKSMCNPEFSISIVEEYFEFRIIAIAAHELGHSLGARHDMDGNKCFAFFLYIMTSRFRFPTRSKATNPWQFSKCSIDYFRKYIETLNSNGTNCLLTTEANAITNEIAGFLGDQPGQVYAPDKQCQVNFQSEESHVCRDKHKGKYTSACSQGLLCRVPGGGGACEKIVPADGTPCDVDKWCMGGRCIPTLEPLEWMADCPLGDTPGLLTGGGECPDLVTASPRLCYNSTLRLECCESCASVYTGISDCEYGDRQVDCQADRCPSYTFDIQNVTCCGTCHNFFNPTTPTTPGPSTTTPTPTPTVTTPKSADVVATPATTGIFGPEPTGTVTWSFEMLADTSTKSEKLMKSELMPTSETSFPATTSPVSATTGTGGQGSLTHATTATIDGAVSTGSQNEVAGESRKSTLAVPSNITPVSPGTFATTTSSTGTGGQSTTMMSAWASKTPTAITQGNPVTQSATLSPSVTTFGHNPYWKGGPGRMSGRTAHMARLWSIKRLQQLRQLRLRQRQEEARRRWLYHYNRLRHRKTGVSRGPNWRRNGRIMQTRNRFGEDNLSWEYSMEEVENERDADNRQWRRGKRRRRSSVFFRGADDTSHKHKKRRKKSILTKFNRGSLVEMEKENYEQSLPSLTSSLSPLNTVSSVTIALNTKRRTSLPTTIPTVNGVVTKSTPMSNSQVIILSVVPRTNLSPNMETSKKTLSHAKEAYSKIIKGNKQISDSQGENQMFLNTDQVKDDIQYVNTENRFKSADQGEKSPLPETSTKFFSTPDFLLHKPKQHLRGTSENGENHIRLKYEIINFEPSQADANQGSWVFHAMIDPSMIPAQTKWINIHQKHKDRMMPFDGEVYRGRSKGAKIEPENGKESILRHVPDNVYTGEDLPHGEAGGSGDRPRPRDSGLKGENRIPSDVESRLLTEMDVPLSPEQNLPLKPEQTFSLNPEQNIPQSRDLSLTVPSNSVQQQEPRKDSVKDKGVITDVLSDTGVHGDAKKQHKELTDVDRDGHIVSNNRNRPGDRKTKGKVISDERDSREESEEESESVRGDDDSVKATASDDRIPNAAIDSPPKRNFVRQQKGDTIFDSIQFISGHAHKGHSRAFSDDRRDVAVDDQREVTVSQRLNHENVDTGRIM